MKWFHLGIDSEVAGPAWAVMAHEYHTLLRQCFDARFLNAPFRVDPTLARRSRMLRRWMMRRALCRSVTKQLDRHGPNVLQVLVVSYYDLASLELLEPIWDRFDRIQVTIIDTVDPEYVSDEVLDRPDHFVCFTDALCQAYSRKSRGRCVWGTLGVDTRRSGGHKTSRPIDFLVIGRRWREFHDHVFPVMTRRSAGSLYLDFSTRPQGARPPREEFEVLMATYARSKVALCFETSTCTRFQGMSALTAKFLQAWAAGCTVVGSRPLDPSCQSLIDWPDSVLEVPIDPSEWVDFLDGIVGDREAMLRRSARNRSEAVRRFDSRIWLSKLVDDLGLPATTALERQVEAVLSRDRGDSLGRAA